MYIYIYIYNIYVYMYVYMVSMEDFHLERKFIISANNLKAVVLSKNKVIIVWSF